MNAVGIEVSKGKSMVAIMQLGGKVIYNPTEVVHDHVSLETLAYSIIRLGEDTRVIMEATGRYHEPIAAALHEHGVFVCVLNPIVIKQSGAGSVRKVKSDKKDSLKIAKYGLDNWGSLREHTPMDAIRQQLKLFSRQYNMLMQTSTSLQNNLISLLDKTFPAANKLFDSPARSDGHQKWVDFVMDFWHCDCINRVSMTAFTERYRKWCTRKGYNFKLSKAEDIYCHAACQYTTLPRCETTKLLITTAVKALLSIMIQRATIKCEVISLAKQLPEYDCVLAMYGVGEITGAQLMAELGDIRRFANRGAIVAFAGIDPSVNESGSYRQDSNSTTKRGSPYLRKVLFQVVDAYLKTSPSNEPVFDFLVKKRSEGKPFFVCMTAAANKFLRIYHARVKEYLTNLDTV